MVFHCKTHVWQIIKIKTKTIEFSRKLLSGNGTEMLFFNKKQPPLVYYKNGVLKNFAKFTGKRLRRSLFFNKDESLR